jgi:hypothetical protein
MYPALADDNKLLFVFYILFILIYFFSLTILLVDFITNGVFRRAQGFARYFYPFSYFFRYLTLSFFYRKSILVLVSNLKRWQSIALPFLIVLIIIGYNQGEKYLKNLKIDDYYAQSGKTLNISNYESLRDPNNLLIATIPSETITTSFFKLYLKDLKVFEGLYEQESEKEAWLRWDDLSYEEKAGYIEKYVETSINGAVIKNLEWYFTRHKADFHQGYASFIDLRNHEPGKKILRIGYNVNQLNERQRKIVEKKEAYLSNIVFYFSP